MYGQLLQLLARRAEAGNPLRVGLIGAGKFSNAAIQGRAHAEDDAKALYDLLTDPKYLGVPKDHVKLLLGGAADKDRHSEEATRDNILKAAGRTVHGPNGGSIKVLDVSRQESGDIKLHVQIASVNGMGIWINRGFGRRRIVRAVGGGRFMITDESNDQPGAPTLSLPRRPTTGRRPT